MGDLRSAEWLGQRPAPALRGDLPAACLTSENNLASAKKLRSRSSQLSRFRADQSRARTPFAVGVGHARIFRRPSEPHRRVNRTRTRTRTRSTRWPRFAFVGSTESAATPSVFKRIPHVGWIRHPSAVEYEYRCTEYEYEYEANRMNPPSTEQSPRA